MPQLAAEGSNQPGVEIDWDENPSILLGVRQRYKWSWEQVWSRSLKPMVLTHWEAFLRVMPQSQPHNLAGCFLGYPCTAQCSPCHRPSKL